MHIDDSFTRGAESLLNKKGARWSVSIRGPFMDTLVIATTIPFSAIPDRGETTSKVLGEISSLFTDKNYFYEVNTAIKTIEITQKRVPRWTSSLPMKRKRRLSQ